MSTELARDSWRLPPLDLTTCGPYADFPRLTDAEKKSVWDAYRARKPQRVPVSLGVNNRVFMLDPQFNTEGLTYREVFNDVRAMLIAQLRISYLICQRHAWLCDAPTSLPEQWDVSPHFQNVFEAASFGAPVEFRDGEVPSTVPPLTADTKRAIFELDLDRQLEMGLFKRGIEMTHALREITKDATFFGRPIKVTPFAVLGTDGPLTMGLNLLGDTVLREMRRDPAYFHELMHFLVIASIKRHDAFMKYWDLPLPEQLWIADDSIAVLGPAQYREFILPHHRLWFETLDPQRQRVHGIHLCGDATRHFKTIHDELGVTVFDTGFPVDFGQLRRTLGPDVEISGGVEVPLLMEGTPEQVYRRARDILASGITEGGRFMLREGNNLPPKAPWANLAAMYKAAFDAA
jgi:uroporphyrinogen-III decarboxylase